MLRNILLVAAISSIVVAAASSQAPQPETPPCNEEFARFLVEQQVTESRTVEQTDKRIRILIRAAEFLWKVEEPVGREYFSEAFKVANDRYREKGFERIDLKGSSYVNVPDHRFEVIKSIASKDAAWARRLIEQVLKEYEKDTQRKDYFDRTREIGDIVELAEKSIKINPEFSRALLRRVMQHPSDFHWYWALFSIAQEDRAFSDALYVELLTNYANSTARGLLFLSAYPFARDRVFGIERYQYGAYVPPSLSPNRELQRQFISTFLRRVVAIARDPENLNRPVEEYHKPEPVYIVSALAELEPIVVQQHPSFLQQLSEAKALATGMLSEQMRKDMAEREKRNEELGYGFDRRLKQLEEAEADGKLTDQMIVHLLTWGDDTKTESQFKQIEPWLAKIQDDKVKYETINYFWFGRAQLAVKERRFDDADRYARKIPEIEHRAVLFFEIAEAQLKNVNDAATVYQTLRDVARMAEQAETSVEKARILIALSNLYLMINPVFALQELSDAIKVINRIESGNVLSTSVYRKIEGKNFSVSAGFSLPGQNLEGTFKEISKNNFELSLSNAKSLDDKYLRTLAVLAVAQNCVGTTKKKPTPKKPVQRTEN